LFYIAPNRAMTIKCHWGGSLWRCLWYCKGRNTIYRIHVANWTL